MALAEGVSEAEARQLAQEGKAVVWIDGGLHATEVVGAQQLLELVYRLTSATDPETLRFLDDLIILAVHCNPDGMELVSNWYHRNDDQGIAPEERESGGLPVLYHYYAGHDNNRDFYMGNLEETTNMLRVQYREWFPQIIYNHHQTGPQGTIMFVPPFRNPPEPFPGSPHHDLPGPGGQRHAPSVRSGREGGNHHAVRRQLLHLVERGPTNHPLLPQLHRAPDRDPGRAESPGDPLRPPSPAGHHRHSPPRGTRVNSSSGPSIEYSQTANWAVMDYASRNKDILLFNIWRMGMNSIEKGSQDSWTVRPSDIYAAADELGGPEAPRDGGGFSAVPQGPGKGRPPGVHHPLGPGGFPHRRALRQHPHQERRHRPASHFRLQGGGNATTLRDLWW